eukprot:SM000006S19468  [mRNA]  locus=s6:942329:943780:+ [translate_table: standard]
MLEPPLSGQLMCGSVALCAQQRDRRHEASERGGFLSRRSGGSFKPSRTLMAAAGASGSGGKTEFEEHSMEEAAGRRAKQALEESVADARDSHGSDAKSTTASFSEHSLEEAMGERAKAAMEGWTERLQSDGDSGGVVAPAPGKGSWRADGDGSMGDAAGGLLEERQSQQGSGGGEAERGSHDSTAASAVGKITRGAGEAGVDAGAVTVDDLAQHERQLRAANRPLTTGRLASIQPAPHKESVTANSRAGVAGGSAMLNVLMSPKSGGEVVMRGSGNRIEGFAEAASLQTWLAEEGMLKEDYLRRAEGFLAEGAAAIQERTESYQLKARTYDPKAICLEKHGSCKVQCQPVEVGEVVSDFAGQLYAAH